MKISLARVFVAVANVHTFEHSLFDSTKSTNKAYIYYYATI